MGHEQALLKRKELLVEVEFYGGWLMADGQTIRGKKCLNNTVFVSFKGILMISSIDVSKISKDGVYLCFDLVAARDKVGAKYVVGVVLDGASACKKALRLIEQAPYFIWGQRCACHGASLLSGDIARFHFFKKHLQLLLKFISFINNHQAISNICNDQGCTGLNRPAKTRMLGLVIAAESVVSEESKLLSSFYCPAMAELITARGNDLEEEVIEGTGPPRRKKFKEVIKEMREDCCHRIYL
jgi:hypothetical protein